MFHRVLLKGELGSECFVGSIVKLEVDKLEATEVVNKDDSALAAILSELVF